MEKTISSKKGVDKIVMHLVMLFLSWGVFQIEGLMFFVIFETIYCLIEMARVKSIYLSKYAIINTLFITLVLSTISSIFSYIPLSYKKFAVVMLVTFIPMYFFLGYIEHHIYKTEIIAKSIIKYMKIGFAIQLIYVLIQFIAAKVFGVDLNRILFCDLFHFMENPSFYRQGTYFPSGFTWHSAMLAPLYVLSLLLFKNVVIRCIIILDAFICGNSTSIIGVAICCALLILDWLFKNKDKRIRKTSIVLIMGIIIFGLLLGTRINLYSEVISRISYLVFRLLNSNSDSSTQAHFSYYLLYPRALHNMGIIQTMFGTGYQTSGYSITFINGQYDTLAHWAVESDLIDILVSRGIIGFIVMYTFMAMIAIKGYRINHKYMIAMIGIFIEGVGYNVQFEYVFLIEMVMYIMIKHNIDFFNGRQYGKRMD